MQSIIRTHVGPRRQRIRPNLIHLFVLARCLKCGSPLDRANILSKNNEFLSIAIDRCIVIYLDLCKMCAQQTQFIGSYVFGWSFRLSMPRLGKSCIFHIRWSKKYQTLWSIWNHDFQRCCKYFEFQFHPSPTRYCQNCIRLFHHSTESPNPRLALCIALEDLLKQNRKINRNKSRNLKNK